MRMAILEGVEPNCAPRTLDEKEAAIAASVTWGRTNKHCVRQAVVTYLDDSLRNAKLHTFTVPAKRNKFVVDG